MVRIVRFKKSFILSTQRLDSLESIQFSSIDNLIKWKKGLKNQEKQTKKTSTLIGSPVASVLPRDIPYPLLAAPRALSGQFINHFIRAHRSSSSSNGSRTRDCKALHLILQISKTPIALPFSSAALWPPYAYIFCCCCFCCGRCYLSLFPCVCVFFFFWFCTPVSCCSCPLRLRHTFWSSY